MKALLFDKRDTDQLKGLSIILIVVHHLFQYLSSKYGIVPSLPFRFALQQIGWIGSSAFFLLSGFGMECSINNNSPICIKYIVQHLTRLIYPFLFVSILDIVTNGFSGVITFKNLFTFSTTYNQYWFLKEIILLYLIILFSRLFFKDKKTIPVILSVLLALSLMAFNLPKFWWNSIMCFPVGIILAEYGKTLQQVFSSNKWAITMSTLAIAFIIFILSMKITYFELISSILISLSLVMIMAMLKINLKSLQLCSKNSLLIYLFHIYMLSFFSINKPLLYIFIVIFGTIFLVSAYNIMIKIIERMKV